jgi:hypothetical protein
MRLTSSHSLPIIRKEETIYMGMDVTIRKES